MEIKHFRKAISEDDHCIQAYYNIGIVYLDLGLPDEAKKFLEKALEKCPDDGSIYFALANLMYKSNLNMYIGNEYGFLIDCHDAINYAADCYYENNSDVRKEALVESLLNFAAALGRHAAIKGRFEKKILKIISDTIKIAEEIDPKNCN
jgi:tetratricopeptide (TPR) repeat protein